MNFLTDPIFYYYLITVVIAAVGGSLLSDYSGARDQKYKPALQPPSYIFIIVWPILFILNIVAGYLADINAPDELKDLIRFVFAVQIFLNFLFSYLGTKNIYTALYIIVVLTLTVTFLTYLYFTIYPIAGWIFLPYLIWLIFATYLLFQRIRIKSLTNSVDQKL